METQVFQYRDKNDKLTYFNITEILSVIFNAIAMTAKPPTGVDTVSLELTEEFIKDRAKFGIEEGHLNRINPLMLYVPLVVIEYEQHHVVIDGNHRALKLHAFGHKHVKAFLLKKQFWKDYVVNLNTHKLESKHHDRHL